MKSSGVFHLRFLHGVQLAIRVLGGVHLARAGLIGLLEAIVLRAVEADAPGIFRREGLRHLAAKRNRHGRVAAGARVVEVTAEPAGVLEAFRIAGRLPDFRRAEMRAVRVRVADALDDRQLPGVVKFLKTSQRLMQTDFVGDFQDENVLARNVGTVQDSALPRTVLRRNSRRVLRVMSVFIELIRET